MTHRFIRLCTVMVASVALAASMSAVAVANPGADLSVTATSVGKGPPRAAVGGTVTYAITLTNLGPDTASGTVLGPLLPDQFNLVSLTCRNDTFCSSPGGELAPGATVTAILIAVVCCFPKGDPRTTRVGAGVTTTTPDPDLGNNNAAVVTRILGRNT
jgi:uncharacterized repeat protein (TIGR01451 family)